MSIPEITRLCLNNGFEADGSTKTEPVKFITKDSYPLAGAPAIFGGRLRLRDSKSNWKVTIGKRTTCFYRVEKHRSGNFKNFPTKNIDEVSLFLQTLETESAAGTISPPVESNSICFEMKG